MEMKKFNDMLEIDILRNSSQKKLGVLRDGFYGFALLAKTMLWATWRARQRIQIRSDNMNMCIVVMSGKSLDSVIQAIAREIYIVSPVLDIDLVLADALSM